MSELQIRKIVYRLLQAGLVEIIRPRRSMAAQPAARASSAPSKSQQQKAPNSRNRRPAVKRGIIQRLIGRIREL